MMPLMQKTATRQDAPPASVRIILQSSELHKMAPSDTKFASKEEINKERDGILLYDRIESQIFWWILTHRVGNVDTAVRNSD